MALTAGDREGPERGEADALSDAVRARWRRDPAYRPPTLRRVRAQLDAAARPTTWPARTAAAAAPRETAEA